MTETLESQIDRLANFIMAEVPGEPSQSEGAVDTAIRWMRSALASSSAEPSGEAEPVAWKISGKVSGQTWFQSTPHVADADRSLVDITPLYAAPTQPASPIEQGEVGRLLDKLRCSGEWLHREAATALAALQAELAEARAERDEAIDDAKFAERIATKREIDAHAERDAAIARADRAEALTAATAVAVPGMVLVPREPTLEMYNAAYSWFGSSRFNFGEMYRAALAASPSAQTDGGRDGR